MAPPADCQPAGVTRVAPTRIARPEDAAEVARLAGLMFASFGPDIDDPDWPAAVETALAVGIGSPSTVLVIDDPDVPGRLAAVGAGVVDPRLPRPGAAVRRAGYVQWISTDPSQRRQGHASTITKALLAWFEVEGVTSVSLNATPSGEPIYRSLGFKEPGQVYLQWSADGS